ncbi:MAG: hypothetical protein Q9178_004787 [Gyalolechia marmorata]
MDGGQWSQDLPARPRGRATPRDSHERHGGRRPLDHPIPFLDDEGRNAHHYPSQRKMPSRRSKEHNTSLEDGIQDLFEAINEGIDLFTHFTQDYQQDVERISRYCDKHLIDAIWMEKVRGSPRDTKEGRAGRRRGGPDRELQREERMEPPALRSMMKQLLSSIETTVNAVDDFRPSQRRPSRYKPEDIAKIRQQLNRSYQNLRRSFPLVMDRRSEMEHVTTEMEMLGLFLGRNGAEGNADSGPRGGGPPSERRRTGESEVGGPSAYGGGMDEPTEEWSGGQGAGPGRHRCSREDRPTNKV